MNDTEILELVESGEKLLHETIAPLGELAEFIFGAPNTIKQNPKLGVIIEHFEIAYNQFTDKRSRFLSDESKKATPIDRLGEVSKVLYWAKMGFEIADSLRDMLELERRPTASARNPGMVGEAVSLMEKAIKKINLGQ